MRLKKISPLYATFEKSISLRLSEEISKKMTDELQIKFYSQFDVPLYQIYDLFSFYFETHENN